MQSDLSGSLNLFLKKSYQNKKIKIPESENPIYFSNQKVKPYLEASLDSNLAKIILDEFKGSFHITLNKHHFLQAAERGMDYDSSNYDAIWVRDSIWGYFYFKAFDQNRAYQLIYQLFLYYQSETQIKRFKDIIKNPQKKNDLMAVPHIRFNAKDPCFLDVQVNGKDQIWNHKQNDAHGLFLIALFDAFNCHILKFNEFKDNTIQLIELFFGFFETIDYTNYEDSGSWEEIERVNTSSIGLVAQSAYLWKTFAKKNNIQFKANLNHLYLKGLEKVKCQLTQGGESPGYPKTSLKYRTSDIALLHLLAPYPLEGLNFNESKLIFEIIKPLIKSHGVIRYINDSYQAANFWLNIYQKENLTDDTSSEHAFSNRNQNMLKNTEAQWFFDSLIALALINFYNKFPQQLEKETIKKQSAYHIKRALSQLTQNSFTIAADGTMIKENQLPESINTVILNNKTYFLPSPITPLNWAKASLSLALKNFSDSFKN